VLDVGGGFVGRVASNVHVAGKLVSAVDIYASGGYLADVDGAE